MAELLAPQANGFLFFKDLMPKNYKNNDVIDIHAGQLWSARSTVPFDFYKLDWCTST